jgi:hypothetical protein
MFVCSPKTPKVNGRIADVTRHWKYIVRAGELAADDGLPCFGARRCGNAKAACSACTAPTGLGRGWRDTIWLSPCDEHDDGVGSIYSPESANWDNVIAVRDSCLKHGYRMTLQMHKLIGVE